MMFGDIIDPNQAFTGYIDVDFKKVATLDFWKGVNP